MKRSLLVLLCVALGLFAASNAMAAPGDGVPGSSHDLSIAYPAAPGDPLTRICIYCHTPHHAIKLNSAVPGGAGLLGSGDMAPSADFDYLPLWNHNLNSAYVGAYTPYWAGPGAPSVGSKATNATLGQPGGTSLLCLSCHDGTVAVNSYGWAGCTSVSSGTSLLSGCVQIGKDGILQNHHPIGFNYDSVFAYPDVEIRDADNTLYSLTPLVAGSNIRSHLYGSGNTMMECGTCHSVHNKGNTGETLLWRSDANSKLCLTCHDKGSYDSATP